MSAWKACARFTSKLLSVGVYWLHQGCTCSLWVPMLRGGISLNSSVPGCFIQSVLFPVRFPILPLYPGNRSSLTEIHVKIQTSVSLGQQLLLCLLSDQISDEVGTTYEGRPCICSWVERRWGEFRGRSSFQGFRFNFLSRASRPDHVFPLTSVQLLGFPLGNLWAL